MSDALERYLALQEEAAQNIADRNRLNARIIQLHEAARPYYQELLKQMTLGEINQAYDARCAAILGYEPRRRER